jgi:hypothetical protein
MRLRFGPRLISATFKGARPRSVRLAEVDEEARSALRLAVEALAEAGAVAWVTYGTLLGLVREGRLLPHDNDIDIAVIAGADGERIKAGMAARGLTLMLAEAGAWGITKLKFNRGQVVIDLFFVRDEGPELADYCTLVSQSLVRSTHPPVTVELRELGGMVLPVPRDAEAYLAHLYGPGWRQPVTDWNWYLSPPNAEVIAHWSDAPKLVERWVRWRWRRRARA